MSDEKPKKQAKKHALTPAMEAAKWKKGQSGNPAGRAPKGCALADVMREYLEGEIEGGNGVTRKQAFVKAIYARAMKGGEASAKMIWNYIDGMPVQKLQAQIEGVGDITREEIESMYKEIKK